MCHNENQLQVNMSGAVYHKINEHKKSSFILKQGRIEQAMVTWAKKYGHASI